MTSVPGRRRGLTFTPAQVLVTGFAGLILIGAILLWLPISHEPGKTLSFVDALFTATSAVCVTGLIVVDTATTFSLFGEIVLMLLIQSGGLGIMTLSALMFLLMGRRIGLQERLMMQEALGSFSIAGVVRLTRSIIGATLAIEAVGAVLLAVRFMSYYPLDTALYFGLFHAVSAFNNAGFDLVTYSMKAFNDDAYILLVIGGLITLGGLGFAVLKEMWQERKWEAFSLQTRMVLKVTAWLTGIGALLLLVLEYSNPDTFGPMSWPLKLVNALFSSITLRTAGFESIPTGQLAQSSLLICVILMYIGASPGGTGGGIKTTTFSMISLTVRGAITGGEEITVMGRRLPKDLMDRAVTVATMALALVVVTTLVLLVTERGAVDDPQNPIGMLDVLFEATSAFGTVGLTTGITSTLTVPGRLLVALTMFLGRVGPLTVAVALAQRKRARVQIHYPEERIMIG